MKDITPVNIWHEGSLKEASLLDVVSSYDDLKSYATLSYRILEAAPVPEESNDAAYEFVADKLNLELVVEQP